MRFQKYMLDLNFFRITKVLSNTMMIHQGTGEENRILGPDLRTVYQNCMPELDIKTEHWN
jgi:hypothetical protein